MKLPYLDYVAHMLREYFSQENVILTPVAVKNRACVDRILDGKSDYWRRILRETFSQQEDIPLSGAVRICADNIGTKEAQVWSVLRVVSKDIARERGLID